MMPRSIPFSVVALALLAGCGDDKKSVDAKPEPSASADRTGLMDPNMEKAMKGVRGASSASAAPVAAQDGPPPNGIFAPGKADEAHPPGAPPKVEVIDAGAEPRVKLQPPALTAPKKLRVVSSIAMPQGGSQLPPMLFTLELAPHASDDGEGAEPSASASAAAPTATGPVPVRITVESLQVVQQGAAAIPAEAQKVLDTAKGVTIDGQLAPNGALTNLLVKTSAAEQVQVKQFVDTLSDVVGLFFSPYPDAPIGQGGYWMATDRASVLGMQLVRYRVTKVESLTKDEVSLSVTIRQYLTDSGQLPPMQAPGGQQLVVAAFAGQGQGAFNRKLASFVPDQGQFKAPMALQIGMAQNPQQAQQVQLQLAAQLLPPEGQAVDPAASAAPAPAAPAPAAPAAP